MSSDEETWDRPMTKAEFKRLHHTLQRKRIDTSLMRKVAEIQRWAAKGVPKGLNWKDFASSRVKLRQWEDPKKKLWSWFDDVPDHPKGRNSGLITKWRTARALLRINRTAKPRNANATLKEKVAALEGQNIQLIAEKSALEKQLLRAEEKLAIAISKKQGKREGKGDDAIHP